MFSTPAVGARGVPSWGDGPRYRNQPMDLIRAGLIATALLLMLLAIVVL